MIYFQWHDSPLNPLLLLSDGTAITGIHMTNSRYIPMQTSNWQPGAHLAVMIQVREELDHYFTGRLRNFSVPLAPIGTRFQQSVWQALTQIPYGETRSYSQQAHILGQPKAVRAIGVANGRNPISIIVPCHRVIGRTGSLTGYAGGLPKKEFLLKLEGAL